MRENLYPLKFRPIYKDKIWGGNRLSTILNKKDASNKCGESWEISAIQNSVSVVENGFLAGNNLQELIEIYMGELVGDHVYDKFGVEFPLLIKFIDANDVLSIQVHPDDELAKKMHNAYGKSEMWYVIDAKKDSTLISGFNRELNKTQYLEYFNDNKLTEILNNFKVKPGDVFFMPAGRVHAIGSGILLAEIQQTSDITYRIFDFNRVGDDGKPRELHTELALDAFDFKKYDSYRTYYNKTINDFSEIIQCKYFTTNILVIDKEISRDYYALDTFVIYMCIKGKAIIDYENRDETEIIETGETVLIPASLSNINIKPLQPTELLEVYIL